MLEARPTRADPGRGSEATGPPKPFFQPFLTQKKLLKNLKEKLIEAHPTRADRGRGSEATGPPGPF